MTSYLYDVSIVEGEGGPRPAYQNLTVGGGGFLQIVRKQKLLRNLHRLDTDIHEVEMQSQIFRSF